LIEKGGNAKLIPATKKGIDIKLAANQSKALENKSVEEKMLPHHYKSYINKEPKHRNDGNSKIENSRFVTHTSNVF